MCNETDSNAQISVRFRLLAILLSMLLPVAAASAAERPKFVLIMADDLGYADIGS